MFFVFFLILTCYTFFDFVVRTYCFYNKQNFTLKNVNLPWQQQGSSNHTNLACMWESWTQPTPNHNNNQSHLPLPSSLEPFWTSLGVCPGVPKKSHYVNNKCFHILLLHVWHHLSRHWTNLGGGELILPPCGNRKTYHQKFNTYENQYMQGTILGTRYIHVKRQSLSWEFAKLLHDIAALASIFCDQEVCRGLP